MSVDVQHVLERLSSECQIRICQLGYPRDVINTVNELRYPGSGDIPVVIFEGVEVDEGDGDMPIFALGRVGYRSATTIEGLGQG